MEKILFSNFVRWQEDDCLELLKKEFVNQFPVLDFNLIEDTLQQKILSISISALIKDIHFCKEIHRICSSKIDSNEVEYDQYNGLFLTIDYQNEFSERYPLLLRKITKLKQNFLNFTSLILNSILKDQNSIHEHFVTPNFKASQLKKIYFDGGDTHNEGKSVVILEFSNIKLVYKPHSLANEVFFNDLLDQLNAISDTKLKVIKNMDCEKYGYQEFIREEIPKSVSDAKCYYWNLGALTSIAYFLTLTDIHFDNILMSKKFPVFYDIETLFSAKKDDFNNKSPRMNNNVLNTSILPTNPTEVFKNVDVSGLFGNFYYKDEFFEKKIIINEFTSDIQITQQHSPIVKKSKINKDLERANPILYLDQFLDGFNSYFRFLYKNKSLLINFIKRKISLNNINRVILRDTQLYVEFLDALYNANYLQDEQQEKIILNILYNNKNLNQRIIESEMRQLKQGDIPYFYYSVVGRDLNDYDGVVSERYIDNPIYLNVCEFIEGIRIEDIDFQKNLIEKSFTLIKDDIFSSELCNINNVSCEKISMDSILEECRNYLDSLLNKNIFYVEKYTNLLSVKLFPNTVVGGIDYDLYENFGILLVLAKYDQIDKISPYYRIVSLLFETALERYRLDLNQNKVTISVFSGVGSLIYVAANLYKTYGDQKYLDYLQEFLQDCLPIIDGTTNLDYIDGLSGFIVAMCNIHKNINLPITILVLNKCVDRFMNLLNSASLNIDGIGLAHGIGGLLYALLELKEIFGSSKFTNVINSLLNTTDKDDIDILCNTPTWCRGVIGIYPIWKKLHHEGLLDYSIDFLSLDVTTANGNSLCHGIAGNLLMLKFLKEEDFFYEEILLMQNELFKNVKSKQFNLNQTMKLYQSSIAGLMLGEAGIIYGLLSTVNNTGNILYLTI